MRMRRTTVTYAVPVRKAAEAVWPSSQTWRDPTIRRKGENQRENQWAKISCCKKQSVSLRREKEFLLGVQSANIWRMCCWFMSPKNHTEVLCHWNNVVSKIKFHTVTTIKNMSPDPLMVKTDQSFYANWMDLLWSSVFYDFIFQLKPLFVFWYRLVLAVDYMFLDFLSYIKSKCKFCDYFLIALGCCFGQEISLFLKGHLS